MTPHLRLSTIQLLIVVSTGPIWAIALAAKAGCARPIIGIWSALVGIPIGLMAVAWLSVDSESIREKLIALFAAIAIAGYLISLLFTFLEIAIHEPIGL